MVRTIVSLEEGDKRWLDRYSSEQGRSTAETIRIALKEYQQKMRAGEFKRKLAATAGILKDKEDSVQFVRKLRKEWDR